MSDPGTRSRFRGLPHQQAIIEKISRRFVVAENDNGGEAEAEGEDRAVLLRPLRVGAPGTFLGELVDVAD